MRLKNPDGQEVNPDLAGTGIREGRMTSRQDRASGENGGGATVTEIPRLPFLLEVGSEEIPARFLPPVLADLRERGKALLTAEGLAPAGVQVFATPRRLALFCRELAASQADRTLEVKGPPLAVAYDADGQPTPAANGFARKNGVPLSDCFTQSDERGEYLTARKVLPGQPAAAVLAARLPELLLSLPFPKVMRWGAGELEYARPLQWLVALLGEEIVPLRLGDLTAGRESRGHRTLAEDRRVTITAPTGYQEVMREHSVIVDPAERQDLITDGIDQALGELAGDANWLRDEELLAEVVFLCEFPTPFVGDFGERFFALPDEVIVTALKAHQRYFAVVQPDGSGLLPHFLAVRDGGTRALDNVRRGNERVLRARLADALFYWEFDQQHTPDEHVLRLEAVTWLEGYGSLRDKTRRLERLVEVLWQGGFGAGAALPPAARRAAALCKGDQVSEMIRDGKEFTRLEGIIGAHYARRAGESEAVCRAIEQHYLPRGAAGEMPADAVSSVLGAADRLDTLAGCWLAGFAPTGAKDPYALRRHALALLRIVLAREVRLSLDVSVAAALELFTPSNSRTEAAPAQAELQEFIQRRLAGLLAESFGCVPEVVRAILPVHGNDPTDAMAWVRALTGFRDREDFLQLATGFKRCKNILEGKVLVGAELAESLTRWRQGGSAAAGASFSALTEPAERELCQEIVAAIPDLLAAEEKGDYEEIFRVLSAFGPAIDSFFDTVRVNVADDDVRALRHAFLREIQALFVRYADFTAVAPTEA